MTRRHPQPSVPAKGRSLGRARGGNRPGTVVLSSWKRAELQLPAAPLLPVGKMVARRRKPAAPGGTGAILSPPGYSGEGTWGHPARGAAGLREAVARDARGTFLLPTRLSRVGSRFPRGAPARRTLCPGRPCPCVHPPRGAEKTRIQAPGPGLGFACRNTCSPRGSECRGFLSLSFLLVSVRPGRQQGWLLGST